MVKSRLDYDILASAKDEPLVFTGPPGRLTGHLPIINAGDDRAVLRSATFTGGPIAGAVPAKVRTTVLRPSQGANLRTNLRLDPTTPPGDYEAEVEVGGSVRPAVLHVVEVVTVRVDPTVLLVPNRSDERPTKRILVTNRGNVPVLIGHPGGIALDDERGECRVTRATYEALGSELQARHDDSDEPEPPHLTFERAFGEWVQQGREHLAAMGVLGVRVKGGPVTVGAGEQAAIDLTFRIPKGLDQHTRYIGVFPLYDTDLSFVVVPGFDSSIPEEDDA